jgi:hypothetical protein
LDARRFQEETDFFLGACGAGGYGSRREMREAVCKPGSWGVMRLSLSRYGMTLLLAGLILVAVATRHHGADDKAPVWMIHTPSALKVLEEEEHSWPWALFYIQVKK